MDWRDIPSLSALRAFEAAARAGSFSAAASELNVTHAAVAQHVRAVEVHLGTSLLVREGRGMALTDDGAKLAAALAGGFGQIIAGVRALATDAETRPLSVSVTPTFAENWLMPRLAQFWASHPGFQMAITPDERVVDLRRDGFDMAIRYGMGVWPGVEATRLIAADFTVVAAPQLLAGRRVTELEDLYGLPWIFETKHREYQNWVEASGFDLGRCQMNEVHSMGMVLSAVRSGGSVSVVSNALVADDIAAGRLVALMPLHEDGHSYFIVHPAVGISERAKTLKNWLLRAARP